MFGDICFVISVNHVSTYSCKYYPVVCNLNYCNVFTSCALSHVHEIVRCVIVL